VISLSVILCLCVGSRAYLWNYTSDLQQVFVHDGCGSIGPTLSRVALRYTLCVLPVICTYWAMEACCTDRSKCVVVTPLLHHFGWQPWSQHPFCRGVHRPSASGSNFPPFLSPPLPTPFSIPCPSLRSFSFFPVRSRPPYIQLRGLGKRCKLPRRGLGRSPSRSRIWCICSFKIHLVATVVMTFLRINSPNFVQFKQY